MKNNWWIFLFLWPLQILDGRWMVYVFHWQMPNEYRTEPIPTYVWRHLLLTFWTMWLSIGYNQEETTTYQQFNTYGQRIHWPFFTFAHPYAYFSTAYRKLLVGNSALKHYKLKQKQKYQKTVCKLGWYGFQRVDRISDAERAKKCLILCDSKEM